MIEEIKIETYNNEKIDIKINNKKVIIKKNDNIIAIPIKAWNSVSEIITKCIDINLQKLGISHKQLIDMSILIGTDFNPGIKGLGPKKSLKLIKEVGNIENAVAKFGGEDSPSFEEINEIRKIFLKPNITKDYQLKWSNPEIDKVYEFLCEEFNFTKNRIDPIINKFEDIENMMKQKTLF